MILKYRKSAVVGLALMLLMLTLSSFTIMMHKHYFSLTEVKINSQKHTFEVSSKLFIDDLEAELGKVSNKKINLSDTLKNQEVKKLLFDYLENNFKVTVGGKPQKLEYVGYEVENDVVWCYLEIPDFKETGKISVINTLLYGNFPEQSNLLNVVFDGLTKTARLGNPDKLAEFEF